MAKDWSLLKFLRKTLFCDSLRVRITLVVLAFSVMVASSFLLAATIMRRHLSREAEGIVTQTMLQIEADLSEPMAAVNIVSNSIRDMMVLGGAVMPNGNLADAVASQLEEATISLQGQEFGLKLGRLYGWFDAFDGTFIDPLGGPQKPGFDPAAHPWYTAAVQAGGKVAITQVFRSAQLNAEVISCARRIFDDAGKPLGVVVLDVPFGQIRDHIAQMRLTSGTYGFLMNTGLDIIAHPGTATMPPNLRDFPMEDADDKAIITELEAGGSLVEFEIDDYSGNRVVTFSARLSNGWILTLATPTQEYYGDLLRMALIMLLLGAVLAAALILMLQRLERAKRKADEANRQKNIRLAEMAKMREADELVQITFDATPLATVIFNQAGEAVDCNHAALEVFEMPNEESLLGGFWDLLPERQPDGRLSREAVSGHIKTTYQEGRAQFEWSFRLPSGEVIPGEATLIRVSYKGEKMIAGYYRDLRDSKRMLAEIDERTAERDAQYKKLVTVTQNYKGIVWSVDASGILTTFRGQYLEKLGLNPAELEGEPILAVQPLLRVDFCEYADRTMKEGPQDWMVEIDGMTFHAYTAPIYAEGGVVGIVGSIDDVTEATKLQHELEDALAAAEIANKAKSSFLANMSHEIRTPMNAILGITEILVQDETLPAPVMEGLAKIYASCDLLLGIINDVLDFSKIEAGKLDITPAPYEIASLINDSVQLNMMRIGSKPIEFVLQIDENIPARLVGDELRIKQILNNLLSNAFKYTEAGSVTLRVGFEQRENNEVTLILGVKDSGQGMTKQQIDKLFDEYTRFQAETARVIEGTGLGMAITQRLVYLMNGEIRVGSEPGRGSLFVVGLPQGVVDAQIMGKEVAENLRTFQPGHIAQRKRMQIKRDYMPYGKVLIVDDVETNIYVAAGLMKLYGLQTETAASGLEAIEKIKDGHVYDIVFMDHMMPVMDGMETTSYLRKLAYTAPIVALTANAVAKQAKMFLQNGFDDFIAKPIDIRQLDTVLNRLIRDKQPPEVLADARRQKEAMQAGAAAAKPQADPLLLSSFVRDARKAVPVLAEMMEKGPGDADLLQRYTVAVHGMKSALANIGEAALSASAKELEFAGRDADTARITEGTPAFRQALQALIEKLAPEEETGGNEDAANVREKLLDVREKCEDYDRKGATDILAELKQGKFSPQTGEVLERILEHVLHSDFEEAAELAAGYAAKLPEGAAASEAANQPEKPLPTRIGDAEIGGLDTARGLARYDGDEAAYVRILRSYAACLARLLNAADDISAEGLPGYEIAVHGIKGASHDMFAETIGEHAAALEEAAKAEDLAYIREHHPAFREAANRLAEEIAALLARLDAENPRPKKDRPDAAALAKLRSACGVFDMDGVDAAMAEIDRYCYEADEGLAAWLREKVDMMELASVEEKLTSLAENTGEEEVADG